MSNSLDRTAREQYLAEAHVGVLTVALSGEPVGGTLALPIWYDYSPEVGVSIITSRTSRKGVAIAATGRFGLIAHTDTVPYKYVSVEGPVVEVRPCELERDLLPMAVRYFGSETGQRYADGWARATEGEDHLYVMRPEFWRTADFTADFADLTTGA